MTKTIGKKRNRMTLNDAFKLISTWQLGVIVNKLDTTEGGVVMFDFDDVTFDLGLLTFGREDCTGIVSFRWTAITDDIFTEINDNHTIIYFTLANGEKWIALQYDEIQDSRQVQDASAEISVDEIIDKLSNATKVRIHYKHKNFSARTLCDDFGIADTDDDEEWGGDREISIMFSDTQNSEYVCLIRLDENRTHYHLAEACCCKNCELIRISLADVAFTEFTLEIFCPDCANENPIGSAQ